MEIKKSKKLLNMLIATSFVGAAITPIVLTSCGKKDNSFHSYIASTVMKDANANIDGKFEDGKAIKFNEFDTNGVATLALVPEKKEASCKEFTIKLELPFEDDASADKKSFEVDVVGKTSGLKDDATDFVKVSKKIVDPNNKKIVSWKVEVNALLKDVKPSDTGEKDENGNPKTEVKFDPNVTFSEITFTFKNTKKDAKDDDECKFVYKITYDKINNK